MSTAVDYINRRFDLLALRGAVPVGEVQLSQSLFGPESGEVCTGVQKLAQRWAIEFLTIRGSMPFNPSKGTNFIQRAQTGRLRSEVDVQAEYNFASVRVAQNLRNEEVSEMDDEDRYLSDELLQIVLQPDFLSLSVRITSLAQTSREIILPISVLPIRTVT